MGVEHVLFLALVGVGFVYLKDKLSSFKKHVLPPGPPADPLIGHLRLIPPEGQDVFFYELGKTYGDVIQLRIFGQSMIILNSVEAAVDLLDKRSSIYSDRPKLPIFELLGVADSLVFAKYGRDFRVQRRMIQQYYSNSNRQQHHPIQLREARTLADQLLSAPEDWKNLLLRFSTAVIIDTGYGHQILSTDDPYLKISEECCEVAANSGPPGGTPVDLFPILRYFPSWFPGTYYAHFARKSSPKFRRLREFPFAEVVRQMAKGTARPSFLLSQLEDLHDESKQSNTASVELIQVAAMILYVAGSDTTSSSLAFFILAMALFPECQARAQAEIQATIGTDRLPEFHDRESLPYLECLVQETLRWNHAVPTGVPHRSMEDDIYKGMFIPKGSVIIPNTRGMSLDNKIYKDPLTFDPTRYLPAPDGRGEPFSTAHFGFGRRICPGRFLAEDSLWIGIATMLATCTFLKPIGENGKEIVPDATPITTGLSCNPRPFKCRIIPRTTVAVDLLKHKEQLSAQ